MGLHTRSSVLKSVTSPRPGVFWPVGPNHEQPMRAPDRRFGGACCEQQLDNTSRTAPTSARHCVIPSTPASFGLSISASWQLCCGIGNEPHFITRLYERLTFVKIFPSCFGCLQSLNTIGCASKHRS